MPELISLDWSAYPLDTELDTQLASAGVLFNIQNARPVVVTPDGSGNKVLKSAGSGETTPRIIQGAFPTTRRKVRVQLFSQEPASFVLEAHDALNAITSAPVTTTGTAAPIAVEIEHPTDDICEFVVRDVTPDVHHTFWLTEISFSAADGERRPDFSLRTDPGPIATLRPGGSRRVDLHVTRLNGYTGPIAFEASGLPDGVTATFSPNPCTGDLVTLTLQASPTAAAGPFSIRVAGKIDTVERAIDLPSAIVPNFALQPVTLDVPPSTPVSTKVRLFVPDELSPRFFRGKVALSIAVPPSLTGLQLQLTPSVLELSPDLPPFAVLEATLEVSDPQDVLSGTVTLELVGRADPYAPATAPVTLRRVAGTITSFTPEAGETPRTLEPGTEITLKGSGFSFQGQPAKVLFGNANAAATVQPVSAGEARVRVPRLATSGPLTLTSGAGASTTSRKLEVKSFRNTDGYPGGNFSIGTLGNDQLDAAFGTGQTEMEVNLFYVFGVPITFRTRNPLCQVILDFASKLLDANCFGMSLSALRFATKQDPPGRYDTALINKATCAHELRWDSAGTAPLEPLKSHIIATSLQQVSLEAILAVVDWLRSSHAVDALRALLEAELKAHRYVLVSVRKSLEEGHVVAAYDLEEGDRPEVAFFIRVYDPNLPFLKNEEKEAGLHLTREQTYSRITVYRDGTWSFPMGSDSGWGPFPIGSGLNGLDPSALAQCLIPIPHRRLPSYLTFPGTWESLAKLLGVAMSIILGNARVTRIEDGSGAPRVSPLSIVGGGAAAANAFAIETGGELRQRIEGTGDGAYQATLLGAGIAATVKDVRVTGASRDQLELSQRDPEVRFSTSDASKELALTVYLPGPDGSTRMAALRTTTHAGGLERFRYVPAEDALVYRHQGPAAQAALTLAWWGKDGLPVRFEGEAVAVGDGDSLHVRPEDWRELDRAPVGVRLVKADGKVSVSRLGRAGPAPAAPVVSVDVEDGGDGAANLVLRTALPPLGDEPQLLLSWVVRKGDHVAGQHAVVLRGEEIQKAGPVARWSFQPPSPGMYELTGSAAVIHGSPTSSQRAEATLRFQAGPGEGHGPKGPHGHGRS